MPDTVTLSAGAETLLARRLGREDVAVTDVTRPFYRELVAAGLMTPLSTWAGGAESRFVFTEAGWDRRHVGASEPHP